MNNRVRQIARAEKMVAKYYDYIEWLVAVNGGSRYWSDYNDCTYFISALKMLW